MRIQSKLFCLLLLLAAASQGTDARLVAFQYVEESATCSNGVEWDIDLKDFHVDCGNANHGCTPGHNIMVYGEFEAREFFYSVADIDIGICLYNSLLCTPNILETDMNVCSDLELLDNDGYQECNQVGNYTFEASFVLPNHTWYEDFAFEGFTFNVYISFDQDLTCFGQFVTHVYYGNEAWMAVAVASTALVLGAYYYIRKKRQQQRGKINLTLEEAKSGDEIEMVKGSPERAKAPNPLKKHRSRSTKPPPGDVTDDESVTSTAYLRMLDFSPQGLDHADRMEAIRQAHFDRLRVTRESRRTPSKILMSATSRDSC